MLSAIENLRSDVQARMLHEGGYAIRHGGFARDFGKLSADKSQSDYAEENPSIFTFPILFPYGLGGLESKRRIPVSFVEHTRWCLQYHDQRFRKHPMFPFWTFSIQQKRQALAASKLTMSRRDFDRVSLALSKLTIEDLNKATMEEEQNKYFTDPRINLLRTYIQVTMQHVMGSDASRALNRSKLWSTSLYLNPMTLWVTINPSDRHDPICQIFAGKNIDMDNFSATMGPSSLERAQNVAHDPFAASQFFFFLLETILATLFGFSIHGRTSKNHMGALGLGNAYFGAVEAQGRGSLHLHTILWLSNAPNAEETVERLQTPEFRAKIKSYIQANIRSHIDSLEQSTLDSMERDTELAWSRPPDPDTPSYSKDLALLEIRLAKSQQYHQCSPTACLRFNPHTKTLACKRRAPFELSAEDIVTETGVVKTKRLIPYLNTWNPTVFYGARCNNDIKFISNGSDARNLGFYITGYATKKQGESFNRSALVAKTFMYHHADPAHKDMRKSNASFILRCTLALNREQEYSGQQVMSYLMGKGDTIQSHTYSPIYWSSVVRALKQCFPELQPQHNTNSQVSESQGVTLTTEPRDSEIKDCEAGERTTREDNNGDNVNQPIVAHESQNEEASCLEVAVDGSLYLRSQIVDYQYRGDALESVNFIDFFVATYEEKLTGNSPTEADSTIGRPRNVRIPYKPDHPRARTVVRVLRSAGHRNLPNIIGKWFERNDDPETHDLYCASVLACLQPWRALHELKPAHLTWAAALEVFQTTASYRQKCIQANMQYYYQCRNASDRARDNDSGTSDVAPAQADDLDMHELINNVELPEVLLSPNKRAQLEHADHAVDTGFQLGMFSRPDLASWETGSSPVSIAGKDHYERILEWTNALHRRSNNLDSISTLSATIEQGEVANLNSLTGQASTATIEYTEDLTSADIVEPDVSMLSKEQLRAYMLFRDHFLKQNNKENVPQLLMNIQGEGGTGKSLVISKITELLSAHRQADKLRKGAYTGIAASLIEGSTLHKLVELHRSGRLSKATISRLQKTWDGVDYLIIDEISMVSKKVLATISEMLCIAKQKPGINNNSVPFGGINVILAGDFHQFPPVTGQGTSRGALYAPASPTHGVKAMTGHSLYGQFTTVVILRTQFRNADPVWRGILTRSRNGQCTKEDLEVVRSLIPKPSQGDVFNKPPWVDAVLVTPRRAVRDRWNEEATRSHCLRTGNKLVISHAGDLYKGKPVNQTMAALIAAREIVAGGEGARAQGDPGGLPDAVFLAKGMTVMVTVNVETEVDIANGSRGTIEEIIAHPGEDNLPGNALELHLKKPPACVLVRLWRTRADQLPGLEKGVIPIVPTQASFQLKLPGGAKATIRREQIPLIPAYAFTDYRAQGQTIPYVIVDIARPPGGGLTQFNAYVALSRSQSRSRLMILREFDDSLFTTPPSSILLAEDARLEALDKETSEQFEREITSGRVTALRQRAA